MEPLEREAQLAHGDWLLLVFAVWSTRDVQAIQTGIEFAKQRNGQLNLGIRPFNSHAELQKWLPKSTLPTHSPLTIVERGQNSSRELLISGDSSRNPIWLILRDGELVGEHAGSLTTESLDVFVKASQPKTKSMEK